jgi:hypothetical protein
MEAVANPSDFQWIIIKDLFNSYPRLTCQDWLVWIWVLKLLMIQNFHRQMRFGRVRYDKFSLKQALNNQMWLYNMFCWTHGARRSCSRSPIDFCEPSATGRTLLYNNCLPVTPCILASVKSEIIRTWSLELLMILRVYMYNILRMREVSSNRS